MLLSPIVGYAAKGSPKIDRIDPPHWWTGMRADTLQLMVYGNNIGSASLTVEPAYPGVELAEVVRLDSPNYLIAYLKIDKDAKPGDIDLCFRSANKRRKVVRYPLLARNDKPKAAGFDSSDALYLIMPDRFATGMAANAGHERDGLEYPSPDEPENPNARHGGNIAGMTDRIGYLDSLGVTAVWVNPVLKNDMPGGSYHGYATTDYYAIDPRLGTNQEWNNFVDSCHRAGIKVVMDMIFNHCGSNHQWLKDMPTKDWVNYPDSFVVTNHRLSTIYDPYATEADRRQAVDGWFVREMPDLNQRNPHLMKYLKQNSIWWIEESGIDGIRMDTYPYADAEQMGEWCREVEREYPDFNIVGECWYAHDAPEAFWQRGSRINPNGDPGLPTVMDFKQMTIARDAFFGQTGPYGQGGLNEIYNHLGFDFMMPDASHILTFLDNHDTDRFLLSEPADSAQLKPWKQAIAYLLTSRGIPQIYYGTELLMSGTKAKSDGDIRRNVPAEQFDRAGRTPLQNEAFDFLGRMLRWRRSHGRLMKEGVLRHYAPGADGIYAYSRTLPDGSDRVVVLLNGTDKAATVNPLRYGEILTPGAVMKNVLTGRNVRLDKEFRLAPRGLLVLTK